MEIKVMMLRFFRTITSRVARNIYFWLAAIYLVLDLNINNEREYHYGIIYSGWYMPVIFGTLVLQVLLVYANNLWLVPRFLVKRRWFAYIGLALVLVTGISLSTVAVFKAAMPHINTVHLQNLAFIAVPVSTQWTLKTFIQETPMFFTSDMQWLFVFTMAWYMNDYSRQRNIAERAQRQQVEAELAFLKSQLNPHFLFNTLNNLYGLTFKNAADTGAGILKLSNILRYLLYESNTELVPFEKEQEIMRAYIDLELLRLRDHERFHFNIGADHDYSIPPLLWLPVLENVFKHGTRIISEEVFVNFDFQIRNNQLSIHAANYCKPLESARKEGIGLANLQKRLQLLYPGRYTLSRGSTGHTFTISLNIQLA
jgi:hypothetical protein